MQEKWPLQMLRVRPARRPRRRMKMPKNCQRRRRKSVRLHARWYVCEGILCEILRRFGVSFYVGLGEKRLDKEILMGKVIDSIEPFDRLVLLSVS